MLSFFGLQIPISFLVVAALAVIVLIIVMKKVVHLAFRLVAFGVIAAIVAFFLLRH
jgi:hypothetical protein